MLFKAGLKIFLIISASVCASVVYANDVEIIKVVLSKYAATWRADVTLKHEDEGWKHYADGWRIIDATGNEIVKRTLFHPHVNEQPFTRSESGFYIPKEMKIIFVEAHDLKHGWSANKVKIDMSILSGDKYQIQLR